VEMRAATWIDFLGRKDPEPPPLITPHHTNYDSFTDYVRNGKGPEALSTAMGMLCPAEGPQVSAGLGGYLIGAVCDLYSGDYDPHFLTGLGSALWVADSNRHRPDIASNALRQYLNYFISARS